MRLKHIDPSLLNARQKEAYRFQKVSAILADYGYQTIKFSDERSGADFIAQHLDGSVLKVQLKGRLTVDKKYENKDLSICFPYSDMWYIYPHDTVLEFLLKEKKNSIKATYDKLGRYNFPSLSRELVSFLEIYEIKEKFAFI